MKRVFMLYAALALTVPAQGTALLAHGYKKKNIEIVHPWIMETDGPTATVSMKIRNGGKEPDRLVSARCPGAQTAKLVLPAPDAVAPGPATVVVPAGGEAVLSSGGAHIALDGLKQKPAPYDHLALELEFERAGRMAIEVMVEAKKDPND